MVKVGDPLLPKLAVSPGPYGCCAYELHMLSTSAPKNTISTMTKVRDGETLLKMSTTGRDAYIILRQIYLGNSVSNFITIARVLWQILQKHSSFFFSGHSIIISRGFRYVVYLVEIWFANKF